MSSIIETQALTRKFGNLTAVDTLNLKVEAGEVLGFLGPNGAGKTTTIRMLAGMIAPTSGRAWVDSRPIDQSIEKLHEVIGLLTESPGFYERLSAWRNLEYFAGFYPLANKRQQTEKYLRLMGLWDRRNDDVGAFSKGMKQRLALARALVHEPKVAFLDEPTAGLDPEAAGQVKELIKQMSAGGQTIFLSTHNLSEAEELCQRIAIFRNRLLALDSPGNLRRSLFQRRNSIRLENPQPDIVETVRRYAPVKSVSLSGTRLVVELTDADNDLPGLVQAIVQAGGRVHEVAEEQHSLEEIYLNLVKEEAEE